MDSQLATTQLPIERPRPLHEGDDPPQNGNGNGNGRPKKLPTINGQVVDPTEIAAQVEAMDADEAIGWAIETFHPRLRFAVSFQKTSSVVLDIAHRIEPAASFFYLDTELLFPETYETRDAARAPLRDRVRPLRRHLAWRAGRAPWR